MNLDYQELLVIGQAFQKDKNLKDWAGLSREDFVFLIARLLGTENFDQAVLLLKQIVAGQLTAPSLPPDLALFTQEWLEAQKEKEAIKRQVAEKVSAWVRKQKEMAAPEPLLLKKTKTVLENLEPSLGEDPARSEKSAFEIGEIIISSLFQNPERKIDDLWLEINEKLQENGVALGREKGQALVADLATQAQEEITQIRKLAPPPVPKAVAEQLSSQNEPMAFAPLYQVVVPQTAVASLGKIVTSPLVEFLQNAQMTPEWRQMVQNGLFAENVKATIQALKASGLPQTHPLLEKLEQKRARIAEEQKKEDGKDKFIVKILKTYHRPAELTNKPLYDPETKIPLVRKTAWQKGTGFASGLKENLNRLSLGLRLSQKIPVGVWQSKWRFLPTAKIVTFLSRGRFSSLGGLNAFLWRKTVGQIALRLGKTGLGKAAKAGMAKAAGWVAGKVGIKLGLAAAGTVVTPIVGTAVGAALGFVLDLGQKLLKPLISKLSIALKEPHKALSFVLFGAAIVFFLPTISVVGFVLIGLGAVGLLGSVGGVLGGLAQGTVSFFTALFSLPASTAPIAALTLGILGGLSALTFFIVMTTSAAFLGGGRGEAPNLVGVGPSIDPRPPSEAGHLAESVIYTLNRCDINKVYPATWSQTVECLRKSSLPNTETILSQFRYSVFSVGPGLQCVGFVRGIMAALGRDPGALGDAKDYLNQTPSGYFPPNRDMTEVQVGDIVIRTGSDYGHMGIVVGLETKDNLLYMRVAQAFGNLNGQLEITYERNIFYNGFLRPR